MQVHSLAQVQVYEVRRHADLYRHNEPVAGGQQYKRQRRLPRVLGQYEAVDLVRAVKGVGVVVFEVGQRDELRGGGWGGGWGRVQAEGFSKLGLCDQVSP